jgi:hypothetical protein
MKTDRPIPLVVVPTFDDQEKGHPDIGSGRGVTVFTSLFDTHGHT